MAIKIDGFTTGYYLIGITSKVDKDNVPRFTLHFLFNSDNCNGYSTMSISAKKSKIEQCLGGVPVVGNVYKVYTDKFVADGKLITYLKDIFLDYDLQGENGK